MMEHEWLHNTVDATTSCVRCGVCIPDMMWFKHLADAERLRDMPCLGVPRDDAWRTESPHRRLRAVL